MSEILEIQNLSKSFKDFSLQNITLSLPGGCIMGLVGENGAGKSTLLRLILDILKKDNGTVRIFGRENSEKNMPLLKEEIGVVTDEIGIPGCLTITQVEKVMKNTYKQWDEARFFELCEQFSLPLKQPFESFSKGMKMKAGIAIALSHHSRLLLLDEATSGLDPVIRDEILDVFRDFTFDEEHAVLLSSHIVSDLEKICDYVAFLHKGRLLLCEEKDVLTSTYCAVHCDKETVRSFPKTDVLFYKENTFGSEVILKRSAVPSDLSFSPVSLEELFVYMVKGEEMV